MLLFLMVHYRFLFDYLHALTTESIKLNKNRNPQIEGSYFSVFRFSFLSRSYQSIGDLLHKLIDYNYLRKNFLFGRKV